MNKKIATGFLAAVAVTASMAGTAFAAEESASVKMIPLATAVTAMEAVEVVAAVEITAEDVQEMNLVKLAAEGEETAPMAVLSVDWTEAVEAEVFPSLQAMKLIPMESIELEK